MDQSEFYKLVDFYRVEAQHGRYHNPYTVSEELEEIAFKCKPTPDRLEEMYEEAHAVGLLFWDM
jgi:hypothetical protein